MKTKIGKLLLLISLLGFLGLQSCVEEIDIENESVSSISPKEIIQTNLRGKVLDESNQVLPNATVELKTAEGSLQTQTDEYGQFEFMDVRVKGYSAFIKVTSPGKFDGFRRANVLKNNINYTEVKLLERTIVGTIDGSSGGAVSTASGAQVRLPANGVVSQNGQVYTGTISVAMQWIDPTADDLYQRLVGDLSGIDIQGNEVALGTFGMMNVELLDDQGNELQMAENARAELTWPVPSERLRDAPQSIPVWSYDEDLGTWIEEEVAAQNGNTFVGEVSHFSSWNLDWKGPNILLQGRVTYNNSMGDILTTFRIQVHSPLFGSRGGFLTPDGEFQFLRFPADEAFDLTIINICGDVIYEETYGPFSSDTDLGTIDISSGMAEETVVEGVAVDCDMNPIEGAIVQLVSDSSSYFIEETGADGSFTFTIPYCGSVTTAEVFILDPEEQLSSDPQTITITSTAEVDLGNIRVCEQVSVFFQYSVDTFDLFYSPPNGNPYFYNNTQGGGFSFFTVEAANDIIQISTDGIVTGTGTYSSSDHYFYILSGNDFTVYSNNNPPDLTVEITEYSDVVGEHIGGTFTGSVSPDSTGQGSPSDITGAFRIEIR